MKTKQEMKILKKLIEIKGKYKINHNAQYDGKRGTVALLKIDGKYYQGSAYCSHKDTFDKKIGRSIALGRAMDNYQNKKDIPIKSIDNEWRFQEDVENNKS